MIKLDEDLILQVGSRRRGGSSPFLSLEERVAANLFYRKGVHINVLMKVFKIAKNALYGNALTGGGAYTSGERGTETNEIIERLGVDRAFKQYVTPEMIAAVNKVNREFVAQHQVVLEKRAQRRRRRAA